MGNHFITDHFNGHGVPSFWIKRILTFTVPVRKMGRLGVLGGLQEKMVGTQMKHRVVPALPTGHQSNVLCLLDLEIKTNDHVFVRWLLKANPRVG